MQEKKKLVIIISGLAGAGKSVLCEKIAEHFKIKYTPTSGVLRSVLEMELKKQKVPVEKNTGFWESPEGKKFLADRLKDPDFDKKTDEELFKLIEKGGVVIDSWVMPWLSKKGYKIWLTASDNIRFERISNRNGKSVEESKNSVVTKESKSIEIFKKTYGFTWGKNLEVFDLIINTDNLNEEQVFQKACEAIEKNPIGSGKIFNKN
ncbi:MAG: cytidylate kinase family protein [archaeon]|jgi:cytidylate kinase